jgi:hypothetical protein
MAALRELAEKWERMAGEHRDAYLECARQLHALVDAAPQAKEDSQ